MPKSKKLFPGQVAEIKRMYLQKDDRELAALVGADVRDVKSVMKKFGLTRDEKVLEKLAKRKEEKIKQIPVVDAQTVEPTPALDPAGS